MSSSSDNNVREDDASPALRRSNKVEFFMEMTMRIETKVTHQDGTKITSDITVPVMSEAALLGEAQAFIGNELPVEPDAKYHVLRDFLRANCVVNEFSFVRGRFRQFVTEYGEAEVGCPLLNRIEWAIDAAYPDLKTDLEQSDLNEPLKMTRTLI